MTQYFKHEAKNPDYTTGYITAYGRHQVKQSDSNGPYITQYGKHEAKNPDYTTGYITAYGRHQVKQSDSNGPYITQYGKHEAKNLDYTTGYKSHIHESNEPYITAYGKHEAKQLETNGPYITQYGKHQAKQQESNGDYTTAYGKQDAKQVDYLIGYVSAGNDPKGPPSTNSKDLEGHPSPNLDRTEAFKVGFFNLDDLYVGNVMTLQFPVQEVSPFLSKKEADSIPLAMSQLPSVFQLFSIPEDSPQAKSMLGSLEQCEAETITGETLTCVNSLESMLEFVDTILGSYAKHNILTTTKPSPTATPLQNYTILEVSHDIDAPKWVACHPLSYPYAIYFCHYIATGTRVFKVSLVGDANGDKMEAVGICHLDTSDWNADHIVFRQLRVTAGKNTPVCHFLPVNHLMWVPMQPSEATI